MGLFKPMPLITWQNVIFLINEPIWRFLLLKWPWRYMNVCVQVGGLSHLLDSGESVMMLKRNCGKIPLQDAALVALVVTGRNSNVSLYVKEFQPSFLLVFFNATAKRWRGIIFQYIQLLQAEPKRFQPAGDRRKQSPLSETSLSLRRHRLITLSTFAHERDIITCRIMQRCCFPAPEGLERRQN